MDDLKKELCNRVNQRIKVRGYCVAYDHELGHIWPPEAALREEQIQAHRKIRAQNGLAVTIRDIGLTLTFKEGGTTSEKPDPETLIIQHRLQAATQVSCNPASRLPSRPTQYAWTSIGFGALTSRWLRPRFRGLIEKMAT